MPTENLDMIRVAARLNVPGIGDFVNVYHHRYGGGSSLSDASTISILAGATEQMYGEIYTRIPSGCNFADINIYNLTQLRPLGTVPWPTITVGLHAGEPLPFQTAAFVRATTGFSRNWARKFLGPFTEVDNTASGFVGSGLLTPLAAFGVEWLTNTFAGYSTNFVPMVYYSKLATWQALTAIVLTNVWATIRRRRPGRGS